MFSLKVIMLNIRLEVFVSLDNQSKHFWNLDKIYLMNVANCMIFIFDILFFKFNQSAHGGIYWISLQLKFQEYLCA